MTIFVVGGGTGGHLFPAIALGEELLARSIDVQLITDTRCTPYLPKNLQFKTHILSLGSMNQGFVPKIYMLFKLMIATIKSVYIFIKCRPSLVIGFGGYTTIPSLLAAKLLFIPIMLHEQNCFFGKVNKLFANRAQKIALNFAETINISTNLKHKIIVTGNPVRKEIEPVKIKRDFTSAALNLLVVGGSQGAKFFSTILPDALKIVSRQNPDLKINLVQQVSKEFQNDLTSIYQKIGYKYELKEFFHDMPERYMKSDLVICRSGASTIAELIYMNQPAIMIPFPFAAENHQFYNAKVLADKDAGWYFEQLSMKAEDLADLILKLSANRQLLQSASNKLKSMYLPSASILADTVEEIIKA